MLVYPLAANSRPDFSQANPQQALAVQQISESIISRSVRGGSLQGPAGSGKTTVLGWIADRVYAECGPNRILFAAPTHKAKRVLGHGLNLGLKTKVVTVASLIGVKTSMDFDKENFDSPEYKEVIKKAESFRQANRSVRAIFIDESSMIAQNVADKLELFAAECLSSIWFCGDAYQLPPVDNDEESNEELFSQQEDLLFGNMCSQFVSSQSDRHALISVARHSGPILDFASNMRANWRNRLDFPVKDVSSKNSYIEVFGSEDLWIECLCHLIRKYRTRARAVCYRNDTVDRIGARVRESLYGEESLRGWLPGELVLIPKYIKPVHYDQKSNSLRYSVEPGEDRARALYACTECEIKDVEFFEIDLKIDFYSTLTARSGIQDFPVELRGTYQQLTVVPLDAENMQPFRMLVPAMDCNTAAENYKTVKATRRRFVSNKWIDKKKEKAFGMSLKKFNDCHPLIRPINVMTVHSSQGSTFDYVFAHDDMRNAPKDVRKPLIYVSATRAKKGAYFYNRDLAQLSQQHPQSSEQCQQSHQPSQRNQSRLADTVLPDLSWFSLQ